MPITSLPSNFLKSLIKQLSWAATAVITLTLLLASTAPLNAQTFVPISFPGAVTTEAHGINAFGQIVGSWMDAGGNTHGFLYNAGTYTSFDYPGSSQTTPYAINNAGDIVGDHDASMGFLLKGGVFTTINGSSNGHLTSLNPVTGQDDGFVHLGISGRYGGTGATIGCLCLQSHDFGVVRVQLLG